jgi:flagella basal body P-ring formation protein FlgA
MKNIFYILIFCLFFKNTNAASINGSELKEKISSWLETMGAKTNIEILDNIKYPFCTDKDLFISDISGSYRLIKVSCLGENKWSFIVRNKKNTLISNNISKNKVNVLALRNNKKSGTVIKDEDIIVIKKHVSNKNDLVQNKTEIVGKTLKKSINSNRPIYHSNLEKDWLIKKNSSIVIENKIGSITVKDQGIALENADFMDVLKVKNVKSGKIIYGFAENKKKVVLKTKQN